MSRRTSDQDRAALELAQDQHGVISRAQLLDLGLTAAQARRNLTNDRWRIVFPGVYVTHTGSLEPAATVWAAVLYAGPGAAAGDATALWLAGVFDQPPPITHVVIPAARDVNRQPGIRVHRSRLCGPHRAPVGSPPRLRVEEALLDYTADRTEEEVIGVVLRATQRRVTLPDRVLGALQRRARHPWRSLIHDVLADARTGVASPLERRYVRDVERQHRLPAGERNTRESAPGGGSWYRDVRYRQWNLIVELDGRAAHPPWEAFRDLRRDNHAVVSGEVVLRYGPHDVFARACRVAIQVGAVLRRQGWLGDLTPCLKCA